MCSREGFGLTVPVPITSLVSELLRWWLVHTRANHEKALAKRLNALGISHYLPLVRVRGRRNGRVWTTERPLFPSYMFLLGGEDERYAAMRTNCAATVLHVCDQDRLSQSLGSIQRAISSGTPIDPCPEIKKGRRCRVRSGVLKGLEGIVQRRSKLTRVFIAVDALGQSAELEIDAELLEVVD